MSLSDVYKRQVGRYALHSADYGDYFFGADARFFPISRVDGHQDSFAGASCDFPLVLCGFFFYYWCFGTSLFSVAYAFFF